MKRASMGLALAALSLSLVGCASSRSSEVYTRDQTRTAQTVRMGTVENVKPVKIEGTKSPVGVVAGGATGAALGQAVGRGKGRVISTILGAIVGAFGGAAAEEQITKKE